MVFTCLDTFLVIFEIIPIIATGKIFALALFLTLLSYFTLYNFYFKLRVNKVHIVVVSNNKNSILVLLMSLIFTRMHINSRIHCLKVLLWFLLNVNNSKYNKCTMFYLHVLNILLLRLDRLCLFILSIKTSLEFLLELY